MFEKSNLLARVDASIIVDRLTGADDVKIEALWDGWIEAKAQLVAPYLIRYEVTNVLYQIAKKNQLTRDTSSEMIRMLIVLPIKLFDDPSLHDQAFALEQELTLGATYDTHYLALAKQLNCELWTRDAKLARAAQKKYDWVHLV